MRLGDEVRATSDPGGFVGRIIELDTLNERVRVEGKDKDGRKMRCAGPASSFELTGKATAAPSVGWQTK